MSIYADNWIVDELTGEAKLVKHLNKYRIDRRTCRNSTGGWNKNGKKARQKKETYQGDKTIKYKILQREINKEKE